MSLYEVKGIAFAPKTKRIHKLKVKQRGIVPSEEEILDIFQVAAALKNGNQFVISGPEGEVNVTIQLKSDKNGNPVDNLDRLPQF
ncbi:MAG: hypothetical protein A2426_11055 [Candidatus Lambdaproteobacteria bacterium RIFOXYC1_FULL_56_13]|nr:MAG: hypothetical protein A2426_11055 [Candidatus Lambdaproteobacteria bacterium RIFOXYC1_FULL_56_13]